jgi:hypothetical protein
MVVLTARLLDCRMWHTIPIAGLCCTLQVPWLVSDFQRLVHVTCQGWRPDNIMACAVYDVAVYFGIYFGKERRLPC